MPNILMTFQWGHPNGRTKYTIDSLPASGLTSRLYDWSVTSEHLGFLFLFSSLVFFVVVPCGRLSYLYVGRTPRYPSWPWFHYSLYRCHLHRSLQTRLPYSLYCNLPKSQITRLQQIQNSLARATGKAPKSWHIISIYALFTGSK